MGDRIKDPTNTIKFTRKKNMPITRRKDVKYGSFVCSVRPSKKERNHTRFVVVRDCNNYPG